jgi:hypothetical protein
MISAPATKSRAGSPDPQTAAALQASAAAAVAARISLPRAHSPATPPHPLLLGSQERQHQHQHQQQRSASAPQGSAKQQLPTTVRDALLSLAREAGAGDARQQSRKGPCENEQRVFYLLPAPDWHPVVNPYALEPSDRGAATAAPLFFTLTSAGVVEVGCRTQTMGIWSQSCLAPFAGLQKTASFCLLGHRSDGRAPKAANAAPTGGSPLGSIDPHPTAAPRTAQARAGCTPEHTPLGEWLRGASLHTILRGLAAFRQLWAGDTLRRRVARASHHRTGPHSP